MNEGCGYCGRIEVYPGCDSPAIRYLCGICTIGLAEGGREIFEAMEEADAKTKRPNIRIRRKKREVKKTIANF